LTGISTDASQRNDPFKARVVQPAQFAGYIVEGHLSQVKRPGKVKGVAELQLSFDQIRTPDNRTATLHAELMEVVPLNADSRTDVDPEGGVRGQDSTKDDATKIGAASGVGAIIGAIAGGGKGAAIGAIIGGGAGAAGTMTQRGKDIRLEQGQQLKIRTSTDTGAL
jgi:type IV secretion system protein VirB10